MPRTYQTGESFNTANRKVTSGESLQFEKHILKKVSPPSPGSGGETLPLPGGGGETLPLEICKKVSQLSPGGGGETLPLEKRVRKKFHHRRQATLVKITLTGKQRYRIFFSREKFVPY